MIKFKNSDINFYIRVFLWGFCVCCAVWSFMIFQSWWGNHDWAYLKNGVSLSSGFFEARYSQHLPTVLFFDGNILPICFYLISFFFLILLFLLIACYLDFPHKQSVYFLLVGVFSLLPYTAVMFYYLHYMLPLIFWGCVGVGLLFLSEFPHKKLNFLLGSVGFFLILGSYPPNLALIFTLFLGRQIQKYVFFNQKFKDVVLSGFFLLGQFVCAFLLYKLVWHYLLYKEFLNPLMYNVSIRGLADIIKQIFIEIPLPFSLIFENVKFLGVWYAVFYGVILCGGLGYCLYKAHHGVVVFIMVLGLFLASRVPFVLSESSYLAAFRVGWWGEIALILTNLAFLFQVQKKWFKNCLWLFLWCFLIHFINVDFEIQKVQLFSFKSERLFHQRTKERLFTNSQFDKNKDYITIHFGYPQFSERFCYTGCSDFHNEILSSTIMPAEFVSTLFWEEKREPVIAKYGIWGGHLWRVNSRFIPSRYFKDIDKNLQNIRYWMYGHAKQYPNDNGIYVDDRFIIFDLDALFFNSNRESFLKQFD